MIRRRGRPLPTLGVPSAAGTAPPTPGGATRRPGCSAATRLPRSLKRSGTRPPRRPGMSHCWRRSVRWRNAPTSRSQLCPPTARRRPWPPTPYGLTEREVLVLRLSWPVAAIGEIGAELFISPKDGERSRDQYPAQARRLDAGAGGRPRRTCRTGAHVLSRSQQIGATQRESRAIVPSWLISGQRATEVRSRFSPLSGFSQVASPQNC